jgi:hypothetical protein
VALRGQGKEAACGSLEPFAYCVACDSGDMGACQSYLEAVQVGRFVWL